MSNPASGSVQVGSLATEFSVALLGQLIGRGLRDIVLCPGARSQALALAAAAWEQQDRIRLRMRIDEQIAQQGNTTPALPGVPRESTVSSEMRSINTRARFSLDVLDRTRRLK